METEAYPTSRWTQASELFYWLLVIWTAYHLLRSVYEKGKEDTSNEVHAALLRARLEIVRLNNAWKEPTTNSRKFPEVSGESVERDSTDQLNKEPSEPILGGENL